MENAREGSGGSSNLWKILGIGCGGCLVLLVAAGVVLYTMLPDSMHVERSIEIDAPMEVVFPLVDTPNRWPEWDPWSQMDPNMEYTYEGPPAGVGAISRRTSDDPNVGDGWFEITESAPGRRIVFDLHFTEDDMTMDSVVTFTFSQSSNRVRVTWADDAELEGFGMKVFGLVGDVVLGQVFDEGLGNLKDQAEREAEELPAEPPGPDAVEDAAEDSVPETVGGSGGGD